MVWRRSKLAFPLRVCLFFFFFCESFTVTRGYVFVGVFFWYIYELSFCVTSLSKLKPGEKAVFPPPHFNVTMPHWGKYLIYVTPAHHRATFASFFPLSNMFHTALRVTVKRRKVSILTETFAIKQNKKRLGIWVKKINPFKLKINYPTHFVRLSWLFACTPRRQGLKEQSKRET